jgi:hypothetical protein
MHITRATAIVSERREGAVLRSRKVGYNRAFLLSARAIMDHPGDQGNAPNLAPFSPGDAKK